MADRGAGEGVAADSRTPAQNVVHDAMAGWGVINAIGYFKTYEMALEIVDALRSLPVEQRMEAMGMRHPNGMVEMECAMSDGALWMEADADA